MQAFGTINSFSCILHCPSNQNYRIRDFVTLLTLASITLQHLLTVSHDDSFQVLGGRGREMTQESFNCLSASVILIVDECVDTVMMDTGKVGLLAKSVFDILMHLLTTPQSSVTLLRTLGGECLRVGRTHVIVNRVSHKFNSMLCRRGPCI